MSVFMRSCKGMILLSSDVKAYRVSQVKLYPVNALDTWHITIPR